MCVCWASYAPVERQFEQPIFVYTSKGGALGQSTQLRRLRTSAGARCECTSRNALTRVQDGGWTQRRGLHNLSERGKHLRKSIQLRLKALLRITL